MNYLEIEYKSGLTKNNWQSATILFKDINPKQTNYYIDTPDFY